MTNNNDFSNKNEGEEYLNNNNDLNNFPGLKEVLEEGCPMTDFVLGILMLDKPFGILWNNDKMENFLQKRGYKIILRHSDITNQDYKVAFKPEDECIPETDVDNIRDIFNQEIQDVILNILLKYSK